MSDTFGIPNLFGRIVASQTIDQTLFEAFRHFYAMDVANSAVHCATPRWSPITFRLMEQLVTLYPAMQANEFVRLVAFDWRTYEEDKGR